MAVLEVKHLHTYFKTRRGVVKAVNDVSFAVGEGRTLGLVGESGSGKSVSAMSILRLLDRGGYIAEGEILFEGRDLTQLDDREMRQLRGNRISVIFQEPMTSLNPVFTVARQLCEPLTLHRGMSRKDAMREAVNLLAAVQIPNPEAVMRQYPHQLSGGMRQRVMIAMALSCEPRVLIADEPTTALDVTVQAQILRLMRELQKRNGTSILFITHDLGVINQMADDVAVMYCGQVVESCDAGKLFADPSLSHPYTEGLLRSLPHADGNRGTLEAIPGTVPHPLELPHGCKFAPRCPYVTQKCVDHEPQLFEVVSGHRIRCFYPEQEVRRSAEHQRIVIRQESEKVLSD